jgi:hypothetical protein
MWAVLTSLWTALRMEMLIFAALGAFALWLRLRYGASIFGGFEDFVDEIIDDFRWRVLAKLGFFVTFGAILSVVMVGPETARQAMAAGMAWTTLLGSIARSGKKGTAGGKTA